MALTGGEVLKQRVQHPEVHERKDRGSYYWFFRYRADEVQPDGTIKTSRPFKTIGPSRPNTALLRRADLLEAEAQAMREGTARQEKLQQAARLRGEGRAFTKKEAELERDRFLADLNAAPTTVQAAVLRADPSKAPQKEPEPGDILFGRLAELWLKDYVDKVVAGKHIISAPAREKYHWCLEKILPRWKSVRLKDMRSKDILDWLQHECTSWWAMKGLRNAMSGVISKAIEWEILPETFASPIHRVKLPPRWEVREKRILTPHETALVLAGLGEPNLLICETCLDTGTRISEVVGLQIRHLDLEKGTIKIAQRNWRGDIDDPKTEKSKRLLTLGALTARYRAWISDLKRQGPTDWVFPQDEDPRQPRWDSGVRKALKAAARAVKQPGQEHDENGLDFPGFGPHSLRRANITWRQEVGGSAIETSKIAGHASTAITEEYTIVQITRQDELTRRIQEKRAKALKRAHRAAAQQPESPELAAQRERARAARAAKKPKQDTNVVEIGSKGEAA